ncbi:MAG: winged helix-turn-helix domain-containing protein [Ignavibacteriales bacterium]
MRLPILESLIELGGSAPAKHVLDRVHDKIRHLLTDYDRLPSASDPNDANWRLSARFLRKTMIMEGLLRNDLPHGIWGITAKGRAEYDRLQSDQKP